MAFDPVPWFVGGGAEHTPDVARTLAYNAANGNEGVLAPGDMAVRALTVPGSSVQVLPGACNILNRASGYTSQMYMGRLPQADTSVAISATGSSGGRSDLIVARVEDPTLAGSPWSPPADVTAGPYIFNRVIAGVPNTTTTVTELGLGYSAIPLARIDIPANTGTITQAMITDLRTVANPRRQRTVVSHALVSGEGGQLTSQDQTNGQYWPPSVGRWFVPVPAWATRMNIMVTAGSIKQPPGNVQGGLWVQIGTNGDTDTYKTQTISYDTMGLTQNARQTYIVADNVTVKPVIRGTTASIGLRGNMASGQNQAAGLTADAWSYITLDVEFVEVPDATFQT